MIGPALTRASSSRPRNGVEEPSPRAGLLVCALLSGLGLACEQAKLPASAKPDIRDQLVAARALVRHPSDGGGTARVLVGPSEVRAGGFAHWVFEFEAGTQGIDPAGALYFQPPLFWEWSPPQTSRSDRPGFCQVSCDSPAVRVETEIVDRQLLAVRFVPNGLRPGDRVRIAYGSEEAPVHVDPYADDAERFVFAVDGDGDGLRGPCLERPRLRIVPGEPALLSAVWPSVARLGDDVELVVAALDARGNAFLPAAGHIEFELPASWQGPARVELSVADAARARIALRVGAEGVFRMPVRAVIAGVELACTTNPLHVSASAPLVRWADLHGHSGASDGTGTAQDYFAYARDVAALDVAALTDHDHWGLEFLDETPQLWANTIEAARAASRPGRFLALPGYEWTSWIWGHRHVVYFGAAGPLYSSLDERYDRPSELWSALAPWSALSIPHHPAGGPIAVDWRHIGHAEVEPLVEIVSAHGSSDAPDAAKPIYGALEGHWVRDQLSGSKRLGVVGSGDSHDGHPGLSHRMPHYPSGGASAVLCDSLEAEAILEALRARRVYATNGPRIVLRVALGSARIGEEVSRGACQGEGNLLVQVLGTAPIASIQVRRGPNSAVEIAHAGESEVTLRATLEDLRAGENVWVRVVQQDGGAAWSSPIRVLP